MKKLLGLHAVGALITGWASKNQEKAYRPTDDVNTSSQGGKGFESDGCEVDYGLEEGPEKV